MTSGVPSLSDGTTSRSSAPISDGASRRKPRKCICALIPSARARALGISAQMHFLGFRLDAPSLIGALDLLVVPSLSEGTPLVILEAMTAGVPVVATAVGGIPAQIRHEREGLLVPSGDPEALAQAILLSLIHISEPTRL